MKLLAQLSHFFAIILWIAAALAFLAQWRDPGSRMATVGWAIVGVILVNGVFSFWQDYRAERAIAALQRLLPHEVLISRAGKPALVPAAAVVPGDVLLLEAGDVVPADCRLVEGQSVRMNTATITGEAIPLGRDVEPSAEEDLRRATNVLLAGTSMVTGRGRGLVFATGMHTEFGKIAHLTQQVGEAPSPLQREIARLSRLVALLATGLGLVFFGIGTALGLPLWGNLLFAIGVIVANVPEGLLPTVTLALAVGAQRMARRNALVRHLPSVEALGAASVICTDKTGTLTENRMAVRRIFVAGRFHDVIADGAAAAPGPIRRLFEAARLCHDLKPLEREGGVELLGDPMEQALVDAGQRAIPGDLPATLLEEIPFDSERKRLTTLHRTPEGLVIYVKGALETLLPICRAIALDHEEPLSRGHADQALAAQQAMAEGGLRVLAFAYRIASEDCRRESLESDLVFCGLMGLEDPPRPEVPEAIRKCREAGIRVIMITGDHPTTAVAVGRQIGLIQSDTPVVLRGEALRRLSDTQLQLALDVPEIVFARVDPDQKMRIVTVLKRKGAVVAVTGDGVNDAPALRYADVGIAMGLTGTEVAREAADIVLADDNFASIANAIEEGRTVFANIRKFLTYILTSNVPELVPYLAYVLFRVPLALSVIQILAVDLGTDMVPALGLGAEEPEAGIMRDQPRPPTERLLSWRLLARAYLFLGVLESLGAMAAFWFVLRGGGWHSGAALAADAPLYLQATTACLSGIVVMQVVNVFLCRSEERSAFSAGLFSNRLILLGVGVELGLILWIDYTTWGQRIFGSAAIPLEVWLFMIPFALLMLALEELRKRWRVRVKTD